MKRIAHSQAGWALLVSGVGQARVEAHRLHQHLLKVLALVENSEAKEHLYQVAGDLIQSIPENLARLEAELDITSYALAKMGEEHLKDRLTLSQRALVEESVEGAKPLGSSLKKTAFRASVQEWGGPNGVGGNPKDRKGIVPTKRGDPSTDSMARMQPLPDHASREVAIPLPNNPPGKPKDRVKHINQFEYVKPREIPIKTRRLPQDQSEMPHPFKVDYNYPRRRTMEGAGPFPDYSQRQKDQKGQAKQESKRRYQRLREKIKLKERRQYLTKDKFDPDYKRDKKYRNDYPQKFKRLPQGGYATSAERARENRKKKKEEDRRKGIRKVAALYLNVLREREIIKEGGYDSLTFFRSTEERKPSALPPDWPQMAERDRVETRAHGDPVTKPSDPHAPGSAKIIPSDMRSKDREIKKPEDTYKFPYP